MSGPLDIMANAFQDELQKIKLAGLFSREAKLPKRVGAAKTLALVVAGGLAYEGLRRANQDRKMGRMMRLQQQGGSGFNW